MINNLSEQLQSFGLCAPRSYYIPFIVGQSKGDREKSKCFVSLCGEWSFCAYEKIEDIKDGFCENELPNRITVPSCVQYFGYDYFQYTNIRYPIPYDPPRVPIKNPTYHYSRTFESSEGVGKLYLVFEGVDSCFYVFVNGIYIGFSQISHKVSEFDITDYVQKGENRIDVIVQKWCAGTYFEDQDKWRFTGIFRDVYLLKRPAGHIDDYKITTGYSGTDAEVTFAYLRGGSAAEVEFCGEKKRVLVGEKVTFFAKNVRLWSAEMPFLYDMNISCAGEVIFEKVGVRSVVVKDGVFLLNNQPVKLYGINRHDFHPEKGAAVSYENMERDIRLMKKLNINTVRTSHYPSAPEFYKLCDEYGLYVIAESDLETHGTDSLGSSMNGMSWMRQFGMLSDDERFEQTYLDRQIANIEVNKNRPSVIIWSLGNESGFGRNIVVASEEVRKRDSRPIHYESAQWVERPAMNQIYYSNIIDIQSRMYPPTEWMTEEFSTDPKEWRPLLLCEYAHAMGNSPGGLKEYWKIMESSERFLGGCIWEWADHGVSYRGAPFRYGGDFGERTHDGNFCIDGIVTPDRKIKSGTREMLRAYQPVAFTRTEKGVALFNKNYFAPLIGELLIVRKQNGVELDREKTKITISPRSAIEVGCKAAQTILAYVFINGEERAFGSFFEDNFAPRVVEADAKILAGDGTVSVQTKQYSCKVDPVTGELCDLQWKELNLGMVKLTIWRAPTDNDTGVDRVLSEAWNEARSIQIEKDAVIVKGHFVHESRKPVFAYTLRYTFGAEGLQVEAEWEYPPYGDYIPRFGLVLELPLEFSNLRYCAYGPGESYIDKHLGAYKDVFESKVSNEYEHGYIKPQESGSHFDPDFTELSDGKTVLYAEGMQSFCAIPYSAETLTKAKHDDELPVSDHTYLTLDFGMSGIGSHSCGPQLPARYRFPSKGKGRILLSVHRRQF